MLEVAAGLIFRGGKLLITQRYPQAHVGGLWEFPGGKREGCETFEECLRRELREELGIDVHVELLVEEITHRYPERTVRLKFYRCKIPSLGGQQPEPAPLGCAACRWVGPEELGQFQFPAADARLLEKLQKSPALWTPSG